MRPTRTSSYSCSAVTIECPAPRCHARRGAADELRLTMPTKPTINPSTVPMGANIVPDRSGATFRCWAPRANQVAIHGDFNGWSATDDGRLHQDGAYWSGFVAGAARVLGVCEWVARSVRHGGGRRRRARSPWKPAQSRHRTFPPPRHGGVARRGVQPRWRADEGTGRKHLVLRSRGRHLR